WGSERDRFRLRVESSELDLGSTFDGEVVPEATPSPRTIRFATPALHAGPARPYGSAAAAAAGPRVARLFADFDQVTDVLVGPDFVAVTISRPDRWEALLVPVLQTVTDEFAGGDAAETPSPKPEAPMTLTLSTGSDDAERQPRKLERAWAELGALRADQPEHLDA